MILHHYRLSPFSEKVRAMLGYTGLAWQSVTVREFPPRPALDSLTGGYRKIPVAQIGADVFCDTRVICEEIARLAEAPALSLVQADETVSRFVEKTDLEVFLACVAATDTGGLLRRVRQDSSWLHLLRLVADRINMARKARVKFPGPRQARARVLDQAADLEARLSRDFLFGDQPSIGDFAAYHGLWFIRDISHSGLLEAFPAVNAWMDRIAAFGEGPATPITAEEALAQARQTGTRPLPDNRVSHDRLGTSVAIGPADYGTRPVSGELVAATPERWIIAREQWRCGRVHVHFPRQGFELH